MFLPCLVISSSLRSPPPVRREKIKRAIESAAHTGSHNNAFFYICTYKSAVLIESNNIQQQQKNNSHHVGLVLAPVQLDGVFDAGLDGLLRRWDLMTRCVGRWGKGKKRRGQGQEDRVSAGYKNEEEEEETRPNVCTTSSVFRQRTSAVSGKEDMGPTGVHRTAALKHIHTKLITFVSANTQEKMQSL